MRLFPPDVASSGEFRGILHSSDPQDPSLPADPIVLGGPKPEKAIEQPTVTSERPMFGLPAQPQTFEGWVLYLAVVVIVVGNLYLAAEPFVYELLPEFNATKHGPSSFPAAVHIGDAALALSNESTLAWHCSLALGRQASYRAAVDVNAGATREVAYEEFQADGDEGRAGAEIRRTAARQEVVLDCSDSEGGSHYWIFK